MGGVTAFTERAVAAATGFEPSAGAVGDRGVAVLRDGAVDLTVSADLRTLRAAAAGAVPTLFAREGARGGTV